MALPYNHDGSKGGLFEGLGPNGEAVPEEAVYLGGPADMDELTAAGAVVPGAAVLHDGTAAPAASVGPFFGIASENEFNDDNAVVHSVLEPYAANDALACYFEEGLRFIGLADGAIAVGAEVEVGAVAGSYRTVTTGKAVGIYLGKAAAADTERVPIRYYGGSA